MKLPRRLRTIWGLVLRTFYLDRHNPSGFAEVVFVPVLDVLVWGLLTIWMQREGVEVPRVVEVILGARVLWSFLYRAQITVVLAFLEDIWAHNFINIFVTPVRLSDLFASTAILSLTKAGLTAIVLTIATRLLYDADLLSLGITGGLAVITLFAMGWALGAITAGFIIRWGTGIQAITWALPIALQPLSAVFHPIELLPDFLEPLAFVLPSSYAFEGMRTYLATGVVPWRMLASGLVLAIGYCFVAMLFFQRQFEVVRRLGRLARSG